MHSVSAVILIVSFLRAVAHAKAAKRAASRHSRNAGFVEKLVDKLFDRQVLVWPFDHNILDRTTLQKDSDPVAAAGASLRGLQLPRPLEHVRPPWKFSAQLPWEEYPPQATDINFTQSFDEDWRQVRQGDKLLKPFKRERPNIDQDKAVEKALREREVWRSQVYEGNAIVAHGVMDVKASPSVVWNQLFDFASYKDKVPIADLADVYRGKAPAPLPIPRPRKKTELFRLPKLPFDLPFELPALDQVPFLQSHLAHNRGVTSGHFPGLSSGLGVNRGMQALGIKFQTSAIPGMKLVAHCDMVYEPAKNSLTVELDGKHYNDFRQVVGHWHIEPHPDGSGRSRVFYEIGLTAPRWAPALTVKMLARSLIKDATWWVKKESELESARIEKSEG